MTAETAQLLREKHALESRLAELERENAEQRDEINLLRLRIALQLQAQEGTRDE